MLSSVFMFSSLLPNLQLWGWFWCVSVAKIKSSPMFAVHWMQQLIWKPQDVSVQSPQERPIDGGRSEVCLKQWVCDSCVGGWGKLQTVDSHRILDFLSGQTRVNFSSHKGCLPAFEELITHEVDKFKLYLLPGRLAASQASAKYPRCNSSSSRVCFLLQKRHVPVLAWLCR